MTFALTLVAQPEELSVAHFSHVEEFLGDHDLIQESDPSWLSKHTAGYLTIHDCLTHQQMHELRDFLNKDRIDAFITPIAQPRVKLLFSDMD